MRKVGVVNLGSFSISRFSLLMAYWPLGVGDGKRVRHVQDDFNFLICAFGWVEGYRTLREDPGGEDPEGCFRCWFLSALRHPSGDVK